MNILKAFSSAKAIANADIRSIRKCFEFKGQGKRISLSSEQLKLTAKSSIGIPSVAEEIQIRHLVSQIELLEKQLSEIDKRIEEFSLKNNSPILTIPGISHFPVLLLYQNQEIFAIIQRHLKSSNLQVLLHITTNPVNLRHIIQPSQRKALNILEKLCIRLFYLLSVITKFSMPITPKS